MWHFELHFMRIFKIQIFFILLCLMHRRNDETTKLALVCFIFHVHVHAPPSAVHKCHIKTNSSCINVNSFFPFIICDRDVKWVERRKNGLYSWQRQRRIVVPATLVRRSITFNFLSPFSFSKWLFYRIRYVIKLYTNIQYEFDCIVICIDMGIWIFIVILSFCVFATNLWAHVYVYVYVYVFFSSSSLFFFAIQRFSDVSTLHWYSHLCPTHISHSFLVIQYFEPRLRYVLPSFKYSTTLQTFQCL